MLHETIRLILYFLLLSSNVVSALTDTRSFERQTMTIMPFWQKPSRKFQGAMPSLFGSSTGLAPSQTQQEGALLLQQKPEHETILNVGDTLLHATAQSQQV